MTIKTQKEIDIMNEGGQILAEVLEKARKYSRVNITTIEIDQYIEKIILSKKAKPSFKNFKGYPASSCLSVNDELVHTIPSERKLKEGDILSIDAGVYFNGYHNDAAITFGIGKITEKAKDLIETTKESLIESIKIIKPGIHIGDVQNRIQKIIEDRKYSVIKDLSGHFIGKKLQEEPSIPNIGKPKTGFVLSAGMTFCLEPMVSIGSYKLKLSDDRWTIKTFDGSLSAHFEHTIAVTNKGYLILTALD